ncbi:hypothetical protein WAX74_06285 [Psychrobacillus sp. FJAT-51614]|uniref:Uncharacterized protein n=1 Tax=Psychrobacillus mangrovi TaxID=3117745 RepID=A0ABU8F2L7_9BACI
MKNNETNTSNNNSKENSSISENFTEPQKLSDEEKEKLQVKDGQNNHHVDERGGF